MDQQNNTFSFRSVILATDFSATTRNATGFAALLARHMEGHLLVAHAFDLSQPALEAEVLGHTRSMQHKYLDHELLETVSELASYGIEPTTILGQGDTNRSD